MNNIETNRKDKFILIKEIEFYAFLTTTTTIATTTIITIITTVVRATLKKLTMTSPTKIASAANYISTKTHSTSTVKTAMKQE